MQAARRKAAAFERQCESMTGGSKMIPKDPVMLLSFINLKLRDYYSSFEALCDDLDVDGQEITERLAAINYQYDAEKNRFV